MAVFLQCVSRRRGMGTLMRQSLTTDVQLMPTVVGSITDSNKLASAMGMLVTGWAGGYLMVSVKGCRDDIYTILKDYISCLGCSNRWVPFGGLWRREFGDKALSTSYVLRRFPDLCESWVAAIRALQHDEKADAKSVV